MGRHISFALTTPQFLDGSKTVTRRLGWENVKPGDVLTAVEKCQGLKKGEKHKRLGDIRVVSVGREHLRDIELKWGGAECDREGFPRMSPKEFIEFFCKANRPCQPDWYVTRIEFERLT